MSGAKAVDPVTHSLFVECFIFIVGAIAMIDRPETRTTQWHHVQHHHSVPWQHATLRLLRVSGVKNH